MMVASFVLKVNPPEKKALPTLTLSPLFETAQRLFSFPWQSSSLRLDVNNGFTT